MKKNLIEVAINRGVRSSIRRLSVLNRDALFLVEYPKSGASWIGDMVASVLDLPFKRNVVPTRLQGVFHGHYLPEQINRNIGAPLPLLVVRDPRDVLVSWYFHSFFVNDRYNERHVTRMRKRVSFDDYEAVHKNIHEFLQLAVVHKYPFGFHWGDFYGAWRGHPHVAVTYEQMRTNPHETLNALAFKYGVRRVRDNEIDAVVDHFSFKKAQAAQVVKRSGRHLYAKV